MSENAISVRNLYRYFGALKAVQGVSFDIPHGSVCGFVGANGAGKTTTMRILASLDYPTMGTAEICGYNVVSHPDEVRRLIGWMPDHFGNYEHMTVAEYLDFYARALGYKGKERRLRVQEVMEFTDLVPLAERFSNKLSKGNTQRLGLGRALLQDPQILIMDEPAAGLDPKARVELKSLIRVLASEGKTIFISSHILSELGEMCDSLLFINGGRIVHHGDAESLKRGTEQAGGYLYDVQILGDPEALSSWCLLQPGVEFTEARKYGGRLNIQGDNVEDAADVLRRMIKDGLQITEFHREERNLEDAFIDMLGRIERGEVSAAAPTGGRAISPPVPPPLPTAATEPAEEDKTLNSSSN
jgi:ABC-2 type transport system ATP-binding protein